MRSDYSRRVAEQRQRPLGETVAGLARGRFEWSVLDWNEPAIAFYQKLGAVPIRDSTVCRLTGEALERLARA